MAETKERTEEQNHDTVYIKINKGLCKQTESKYPGRMYNIMTLPKDTMVGDTNLEYCKINPPVMFEDKFNPRMFTGAWHVDKLKDGCIPVLTRDGKYLPIDAETLRDAVADANHRYYESHKNAKETAAASKEKSLENDKAKQRESIPFHHGKNREAEISYGR